MAGVLGVPDVKIIKFLAPLFYANCTVLKDRIASELLHRFAMPDSFRWRALVLCFATVSSVDTTAMQALEEAVAECHAQHVPLLIASANALVEDSFASAGFVATLGGPGFMYRRVHEAVRAVLLHHLPPLPGAAGGAGRQRADSSGSIEAPAAVGGAGAGAGAAWSVHSLASVCRCCACVPAAGGRAVAGPTVVAMRDRPPADPVSPPAGAQPS